MSVWKVSNEWLNDHGANRKIKSQITHAYEGEIG